MTQKNINISYKGDLVVIVENVGSNLTLNSFTLQEFPSNDERPNALVLVAPQNEFLT